MNVDVVEFVDENHDVANAYLGHGADDAADHDALSPEVPEQVHLQQPSSLSPGIIGDHPVHSSSYSSSKRGTYPTPSTLYEEQDDTADHGPLHQQNKTKRPQQDLAYSPKYSYERAGWPLKCAKEFYLLQHYIDKLGSWVSLDRSKIIGSYIKLHLQFDVADSKRHFTKTAPIMAASSPLLMNAILAISALHLSRVSDYDAYEAVRYHDKCLQLMVPMLNDHNEPKDDNLLMTTVFLHLYEDLDCKFSYAISNKTNADLIHLNSGRRLTPPSSRYLSSSTSTRHLHLLSTPQSSFLGPPPPRNIHRLH